MRSAVVVFPGSNRERDVQVALRRLTGHEPVMVWHRDGALPRVDLVVLPGGFSYGDYLRAGAMAARSPIVRAVVDRARAGGPTLGICNGFQVLTECGLLPGALMRNAGLAFVCRFVDLRVETTRSLFTTRYEAGQVIRVPVAHADGNYFADPATLDMIEDQDRVAFRYCSPDGDAVPEANPNGSARNIAGILDRGRTVLGLMPHPENAVEALLGGDDGRGLFESMVEALS
jgi:phosphoribosylformylglycinamidine synthase subunit PurQ / glutaminase